MPEATHKEARIATILVVEHCRDVRSSIASSLRGEKHTVLEASTGAEALVIARSERPKVVVGAALNAAEELPGLLHGMQLDQTLLGIPLVLCGGDDALSNALQLAQLAGMAAVLAPSDDPKAVLKGVKQALAQSGKSPAQPPGPHFLPSRAPRSVQDCWRAAFDHSIDAILMVDSDAHVVEANPAACRLFQYSRDELIRMFVFDLARPADRDQWAAAWQRLITRGRQQDECTALCKDGTTRDVVHNSITNVMPGLHLLIAQDVTERKSAEERLRRSESLLAEAQKLTHVGSWNVDLTTGKVEWSDEQFRIYGLQPQERQMTSDAVRDLIHPDDRAMVDAITTAGVQNLQPCDYHLRVYRPDGTLRIVHARGKVVNDEHGRAVRMFGAAEDITDRVAAEGELRHSRDRSRALSRQLLTVAEEERRRVARQLHDEIGQLLTGIQVNLAILEHATQAPDVLRETAALAAETLDRVRNLARELRPSMLDDLGLEPAVRACVDRHLLRAGIATQLTIDLSSDVRLPSEIETACYRLVQEAVTNIVRHAHAKTVRVELHSAPGALELCIADDGVGFDTVQARTSAVGGASLGLLGMEERAMLLGGKFSITSSPTRGTEIRASFPFRSGGSIASSTT